MASRTGFISMLVLCGLLILSGKVLGGTTFHNFSDGTSGTSTNLGGTTFHNFSDGTSGTSTNLGGTTFHNFNGTSGTSTNIGGY